MKFIAHMQHPASMMKLSVYQLMPLTHSWMKNTEMWEAESEREGGAAQLHPSSLPSLHPITLVFASPRLPSNLASSSAPLPGNLGLQR